MTRQTSRRRTITGIALVGGVAAIGAGAWGVQQWAPFATTAAEVTWPDNVQPLAEFVEATTHQHFQQPISIEFIGDAQEYAARVHEEVTPPTVAELSDDSVEEGVGRALGLWEGDISLQAIRAAYDDSAPFPATWLTDEHTIVVNAKNGSAELSPLLRSEVALLLTQALDDQLFHTVEKAHAAATSQDYQVVVALGLGHAVWVHDLYVDRLSSDDLDEYYSEYDDQITEFSDAMADVPASYRAIRSVSQQIGPMFIEVLTEENKRLVQAAFTTDLPAALDQISLPAGKYLRRDELEPVAAPPGPSAADVRFSNQVGPFALYLLLSTGMPDTQALIAADGWGNDRYTAYLLGDRVCVDVHLVADSRDDAGRMENALNGWAQARPKAANALVAREGTDLYASACDPGPDARQEVPGDEAINHYVARAQEIQQRVDASGNPVLAECVAVEFFSRHSFDEAITDDSFDYFGEFDSIEQDCLDSL
ncbi:MAG: hypothetical protein WCC60_24005 [Ilumatobacteraceae bacterium]